MACWSGGSPSHCLQPDLGGFGRKGTTELRELKTTPREQLATNVLKMVDVGYSPEWCRKTHESCEEALAFQHWDAAMLLLHDNAVDVG